MFQTIIFDFDMTLVNSINAITIGLNKMARHFGLPPVHESDTRRVMSSEAKNFWRNLWGYHDEAWNDFFLNEVADQEKFYLEIAPGAVDLLAALKNEGRHIGLATNRSDAWQALSSIGLSVYFDEAVGSGEVAQGKPAPDMLLLIMDKLKADPSTTLYIGDAPVDMEAARRGGIRGVGILAGGSSKEELLKAGAWQVRPTIKDLGRLLNCRPEGAQQAPPPAGGPQA